MSTHHALRRPAAGLLRRHLLALAAGSATRPQAGTASRPIRILVGYDAGLPDTVARLLAPSMAKALNATVIVEPKPGGSERLAAQPLGRLQGLARTLAGAPGDDASPSGAAGR